MAILYDRIYPRRVDDVTPVSLLSPAEIRDEYITARQSGCSRKAAAAIAVSKATPPGQTNPAPIVRTVITQVHKDLAALRDVNPLDYETGADFLGALNDAAAIIPTSVWVEHLQDAHDVQTFAALKAKLESELGE